MRLDLKARQTRLEVRVAPKAAEGEKKPVQPGRHRLVWKHLVGADGLEPPTYAL